MPELEDERWELIGGEVVIKAYGTGPHAIVKSNLTRILVLWLVQDSVGHLFAGTMFQLDDHNSLIPDLSVVVALGRKDWWQGAPEIAIEVVSSETAARLEQKVNLYLAHGGKSVWVAFPGAGSFGFLTLRAFPGNSITIKHSKIQLPCRDSPLPFPPSSKISKLNFNAFPG